MRTAICFVLFLAGLDVLYRMVTALGVGEIVGLFALIGWFLALVSCTKGWSVRIAGHMHPTGDDFHPP